MFHSALDLVDQTVPTRGSPPDPPEPEHSLLPRATILPIAMVEASASLGPGKAQTLGSLLSECKGDRLSGSVSHTPVSARGGGWVGGQEVHFEQLYKAAWVSVLSFWVAKKLTWWGDIFFGDNSQDREESPFPQPRECLQEEPYYL